MSVDPFRAFVALEIDDASRARFADAAKRLREAQGAPRASYSPPEQMHLTLKFFPALARDHAEALGRSLALFAGAPAPLVGRAADVGAFPSLGRARVVVVPVADPEGRIPAIAAAVEAGAEALGYAREQRSFKPHITLARLREPKNAHGWFDAAALEPVGDVAFTALVLFESTLGANGAVHTPLVRVDLPR